MHLFIHLVSINSELIHLYCTPGNVYSGVHGFQQAMFSNTPHENLNHSEMGFEKTAFYFL